MIEDLAKRSHWPYRLWSAACMQHHLSPLGVTMAHGCRFPVVRAHGMRTDAGNPVTEL